ncbi:aminotransferase class I/II-fold pyridoxal phosphate-dependent enzyme [Patescibacteria group bacterium]|nr:aminotransferase class I/II-fold pyridoxal phosphate-dependent enzyme [Patescibacteria group bacterium]
MINKKPIFISLSPNVEKDDISLSFKLLFNPFQWKKGKAIQLLEEKFKSFGYTFSFNSGRTALLAILKSLGLEKNDEILIQAFTCNAAVNPIFWAGLKPVFVDIEKETLNINPSDLEKKISPKSKAIMVQHTFGKPAELDRILEICEKHNLILIEDCAHALGAEYNDKNWHPAPSEEEAGSSISQPRFARGRIGTFGKAAFFSLGRDKIISSVYGGMAVTQDKVLAEKIREFQKHLKFPNLFWIKKQLLHPILTKKLIMPLYGFFGLGKYKLVALQRLGILSKAVHKMEKQGKMPKYLFKKMPNALALLGLHQFEKLEKFNKHRYEIAKIYKQFERVAPVQEYIEKRVFMRYSVFVENSDEILEKFKKKGIYLDDGWRKSVVVPIGTNLEKMGYIKGSCPVAEEVADKILNLPTHINISKEQAEKIKNLLKRFQEQ